MDAAVKDALGPARTGDSALERELAELAAQLEDRRSIRLLSRALVVGFAAVVGFGVTVRLLVDSQGTPWWGLAIAALDAVAWATSLTFAWRGRRELKQEAIQIERLERARRRLGLD